MGCAIAEAVPIQTHDCPLLNATLQLGIVLKGLARYGQLEFLGEAGGQAEWGWGRCGRASTICGVGHNVHLKSLMRRWALACWAWLGVSGACSCSAGQEPKVSECVARASATHPRVCSGDAVPSDCRTKGMRQ